MNDPHFLKALLDEASAPFRRSGHFAYHYARGKLSGDPVFKGLLEQGLLPAGGRLLDLGCGQGSLFAWLTAAQQLHRRGAWPTAWPTPPVWQSMRGVELMQRDVERAALAFGAEHPMVRVEQGDMCRVDFGQVDVVTILDALHYFDHPGQEDVLRRIRAALPPGGRFLTRVGDVSAGWPYHLSNWVDHVVTFARGHRLPQLHGRTLADWKRLLQALGFEVRSQDMNGSRPFANVMLVCTAC